MLSWAKHAASVLSQRLERQALPIKLSALVDSLADRLGLEIRPSGFRTDFDSESSAIIRQVRPYTMTTPERIYALIEAVRYVSSAGIPGSIVECGVWRGGSMMAVALTLAAAHKQDIDLYLLDTYEGMSEPGAVDVDFRGEAAATRLSHTRKTKSSEIWAYSPVEEVRRNMAQTGYSESRLHFIEGKVEDTLPARAPEQIALLRLDTDWYASTRHELVHLYPRLSRGGVLVIDDYGHWKGARQAVDEYLAENNLHLLLNRVDATGRIAVKP
jgi:O-methyltransferase